MAGLLSHIVGHQKIISRLLDSEKQGRFPHALLFTGAQGVGKFTLAKAMTQFLLCQNPTDTACGMCGPCLRVVRDQHESVLIVNSEKNQIKVEKSREILDFLSLQKSSKYRVVIIDQAQDMGPVAANTILKILEEPPEGTVFFLIAPSAQHLLSTIRSRCQNIRLSSLSEEDLKKKYPRAATWTLRAAQGSFQRLSMLQDKQELEYRSAALSLLKALAEKQNLVMDLGLKDFMHNREDASRILDHSLFLLRDVQYVQLQAMDQVVNQDCLADLEALNVAFDNKAQALTGFILDWQRAIRENADTKLLFEAQSIRMLEQLERDL